MLFLILPYSLCRHLFKWAIAMFTSRSFGSRSIRPDSKYWTTYKTGPSGQRQTVVLDMSHTLAADLDFPVLFPGSDIGNHHHEARIDYIFDPGRFTIKTNDATELGEEVFNNYGQKGNDELLLGYGFCIPNNPHDTVALTLKALPEELQKHLKSVHSGYFTQEGTWSGEKATFKVSVPSGVDSGSSAIFDTLPEPLLELLTYILQHERGLAFTFIEHPRTYLTSTDSDGRHYLPHIARMLVQSLVPKLGKLQSAPLPATPQNSKQVQASIYRQSQISILSSLIASLKTFTRSLLLPPNFSVEQSQQHAGPCLAPLETLIPYLQSHNLLPPSFLQGIAANTNTSSLPELVHAGWEDEIFILLLCFLVMQSTPSAAQPRPALSLPVPQYLFVARTDDGEREVWPADYLLEWVRVAKETCGPESLWGDERWEKKIVEECGEWVQSEGFPVMCRVDAGSDEEVQRCAVYLWGLPVAASP